jgi:plasmid stabilization system protein ParE
VSRAYRLTERAEAAFDLLASWPGIGHAREDLTDRPLKFWSVYSYLVAYEPAGDPLTLVAVLHGARNVAEILRELS